MSLYAQSSKMILLRKHNKLILRNKYTENIIIFLTIILIIVFALILSGYSLSIIPILVFIAALISASYKKLFVFDNDAGKFELIKRILLLKIEETYYYSDIKIIHVVKSDKYVIYASMPVKRYSLIIVLHDGHNIPLDISSSQQIIERMKVAIITHTLENESQTGNSS